LIHRLHFAFTITFHYLFAQLTMGLAGLVLMGQPNEETVQIDNPIVVEYPPIRVVRFSGPSLTFGVIEHTIEGAKIRVYSPAKTVADCFKFRSKVGTELAIQALRECFREKKASIDELWEAAKVCRVANIMRPYMESLT
jgi:hypothetical protein